MKPEVSFFDHARAVQGESTALQSFEKDMFVIFLRIQNVIVLIIVNISIHVNLQVWL
jgi:hypothetical protein